MGRACVHCKRLLPTIARLNLLLFSLRLKKHPGLARDPARNPAEAVVRRYSIITAAVRAPSYGRNVWTLHGCMLQCD